MTSTVQCSTAGDGGADELVEIVRQHSLLSSALIEATESKRVTKDFQLLLKNLAVAAMPRGHINTDLQCNKAVVQQIKNSWSDALLEKLQAKSST